MASSFAALALLGAAAFPTSSDFSRADQQQALKIYRHIVELRTAAGQGKVPEMARYLAERFIEGGFSPADVHVLPTKTVGGEDTASLVVRYRGRSGTTRRPVLMIAHMDVVDAIRSDWERDPFKLIEEEGYFFGRGTLDNKLGVISLTSAFLRLKAEGYVPDRDLVLGFTGDEETGMLTAQALATKHRSLTDAEYVLNADGGGGRVDDDGKPDLYTFQAAEKTYASYELTVRNPGGHSSTPRADNAIYELASVLRNIEAYAFPTRINEVTRSFLEGAAKTAPAPVAEAMRTFAKHPKDPEAAATLAAIPSLVGITRTTCVATKLAAGHAENALPQSATATLNCRIFPGETPSEVKAKLQEVAKHPKLEIKLLGDPKASPVSPLNTTLMAAVARVLEKVHGVSVPVIPYMAPYGTDGREMRIAGLPTYGVSGLLMRIDEIFAHGLNERVPVKAFYASLDYWYLLMQEVSGGA